MAKEISKSQVDRLGDRLKHGNITEDDLRLLDRYRRTLTAAYEVVVGNIREKLGLEPTGRPAKSTISVIDKLKRESIRLTQIQDIAGCRIVVADIAEQESVIKSLTSLFQQTTIIDRRENPSHGYRAVHIVVKSSGKSIEVQIRTVLQHVWAELSEKYSDVIDPSIKYGGGSAEIQKRLQKELVAIALEESVEQLINRMASLPPDRKLSEEQQRTLEAGQKVLKQARVETHKAYSEFIAALSKKEGQQ